jgi:hypothetical protein
MELARPVTVTVRAVAFQAQARHVQDERQGERDGADCRGAEAEIAPKPEISA